MKHIWSVSMLVAVTPLVVLAQAASTPAAAVEELLAADRAFSAKSAQTTVVPGLSAMFADDVIMPQPGGVFAEGKAAAVAALMKSPNSDVASVTWTPIRAGISADGQHGFTFGYMTMKRPDSADVPLKYLSYWVKTPDGWRVAGYKRGVRPPGEVSMAMMPPALPARLVAPKNDKAVIAAFEKSVGDAERAFSLESQTIGLPAAFAKHGSEDAVNMGGGASAGFIVSAAAIGRSMQNGDKVEPSPVSWGADKALAASSGDLGVTFGVIRANAPDAEGKRAAYAFFTVWRRASPADRWLYVAE